MAAQFVQWVHRNQVVFLLGTFLSVLTLTCCGY